MSQALPGDAAAASTAGGSPATAGSPAAGPPASSAPPATTAAAPSPFSVEVAADRTAVTVGDPVRLTFRLRHPRDVTVVTFDADRSLAALTILDQTEGQPRELPDGRVEESRILTLAAYETGSRTIAPVRIVYRLPDGREDAVSTAPVSIEVASVLTAGQTDPADIKPPVTMPERALWPWVAAGLILLAAALLFLWWRRRRRAPAVAAASPAAPPRPPHEIAYAELERLLASGLLEKGEVKRFYIDLAEIIRRYLGARYGVDTFERTTHEILDALRVARLPIAATTMTAEFLGACDLVKFARYRPGQDETRRAVEKTYRLVDETKVADVAPAGPDAAATGSAHERPAAAAGGAP